MRLAAIAVASIVASGCVATRYSPPLDRELTAVGERFLQSTSVVVAHDTQTGNILDNSIARPVADSRTRITVLRNQSYVWPGRGFQCFEPMLYVLTVGIIPADCTNDYVFDALLEGRDSTTPLHREYTVTQVQGWVSGLLALLPGWELGPGPAPSVRAFNSAVNEFAGRAEAPAASGGGMSTVCSLPPVTNSDHAVCLAREYVEVFEHEWRVIYRAEESTSHWLVSYGPSETTVRGGAGDLKVDKASGTVTIIGGYR